MNQTPGGHGPPPPGGFGGAPPPMGPGFAGQGPQMPGPMGPGFGQAPQTGLAAASLACGILALPSTCCCSLLSLPVAVAAVSMGAIAMTRAKREPHLYGGRSMAVAGLACGIAALVFAIAMMSFGMSQALFDKYQQSL